MLVLLVLILIVFFGYLISTIIVENLPTLERIGLSYLLGMGIITLLLFLFSWAGVRITRINILTILLVLTIVLLLINNFLKRTIIFKLPNVRKFIRQLKWYEKVALILIGIIILISFLIAFYFPVYVWDALALYDFTAKIIAQTGYFVQIANDYFYFAQYPLLVSLGHTIVYLFGASNPQFIYSLYFLSFAIIMFFVIKKQSTRLIALFGTLIIVTSPRLFGHSTIAYTNLPYTIFYAIGVIYLFIALTKDKYDYLLLSSIMIGLSTWARAVEPLWIAEIFVVLIYSIHKRSIYPILLFIPTFLIIQRPWSVFQTNLYGGVYSISGQVSLVGSVLSSGISFRRIFEVFEYILRHVVSSWGPIFALFVIAAFYDMKKRFNNKNFVMLSLIAANFLAIYIGTFIFSIRFEEWKAIPDSAVRLSMFFPPLMIYYISLVLGPTSFRLNK